MAHFALLDNTNKVIRVSVVDNDNAPTEEAGVLFLKKIHGENTVWKKTSYNGTIRKNFAGAGYFYDEIKDAFIPPKPYTSWVLNEETCQWEPPVAMPVNSNRYVWNEAIENWDQI